MENRENWLFIGEFFPKDESSIMLCKMQDTKIILLNFLTEYKNMKETLFIYL